MYQKFRINYYEEFLCKISDNIYGIEFTRLKIRNVDNNTTLFEINKTSKNPKKIDNLLDLDDKSRSIKYCFPSAFLRLKMIGTT